MIPKEAERLRIGVLGAGPIAQAAHFDATRKARNAELFAICDAAADLLTGRGYSPTTGDLHGFCRYVGRSAGRCGDYRRG